jgi:alpha-L-fucosidase
MIQLRCFLFCFLLLMQAIHAQNKTPLPTPQQTQWHQTEFNLFVHFGPNTFTDKEWGEGTEPEDLFNPSKMDCRQWCRIAKAAGAKGIIITAKHHDGFCLWPSKFSKHTVRESKWRNGKGDVLKELSQACKEYGLNFGIYISPWDRNHPDYGTEKYNSVFINMMKEIFTSYGPVHELWWDGANGEGPNGKKQVYNWKAFIETVRKLSPKTVIFSDVGPDIRWAGNEKGIAGITNYNTLNTDGYEPGLLAPSTDTLNKGNKHGANWIPAECDVSIRPGWFYHANEDDKVKTPEQLFDIYLKSVGRGAVLLLNVPPDRRGLIHKNDSASLMGFKKLWQHILPSKGVLENAEVNDFAFRFGDVNSSIFDNKTETLEIGNFEKNSIAADFKQPVELNCIVLRENLTNGQRVEEFSVQIPDTANKSFFIKGTTIGNKRILTFPKIKTQLVILRITKSNGNPRLHPFDFYLIDEKLVEKN